MMLVTVFTLLVSVAIALAVQEYKMMKEHEADVLHDNERYGKFEAQRKEERKKLYNDLVTTFKNAGISFKQDEKELALYVELKNGQKLEVVAHNKVEVYQYEIIVEKFEAVAKRKEIINNSFESIQDAMISINRKMKYGF